jgi:sugar phosphate isomerase/epimerase
MIPSGIADECADELVDQLRMHRDLGWEHIEIRNIDGTTIDTLDDASLDKAVETLASHGMKASALASDIGKLWLDGERALPFQHDVDALEILLRRAKRLDCRYIRVMGYRTESLSEDELRDEAVARLKDLSAMAQAADVYLGLENCVGWHDRSGRHMCEFLDRVGSEYLVCLYDTGNPVSHRRDATEFYEAVKDRIAYIHIKDAEPAGQPFTYPGDGAGRVRHVLQDQYERGYRGFVSIEPHLGPSAHLPHMKQDRGVPWETYGEYGRRINRILAEITS